VERLFRQRCKANRKPAQPGVACGDRMASENWRFEGQQAIGAGF